MTRIRALLAQLTAWWNRPVCRHPRMETVHSDGACCVKSCPDCDYEIIYGR